jgi:hypothetical protein
MRDQPRKRILEFDGSVFKVLHKAGIPCLKREGSEDLAKLEQTASVIKVIR